MVRRLRITVDALELHAELNETRTAQAVWEALPIGAAGNRWGDEIYFSVPIDAGNENPQEVVDRGDLGYWEPGSAFCLFFGPTPASHGEEVRPASPVTVFGKVVDDLCPLKSVRPHPQVWIERDE